MEQAAGVEEEASVELELGQETAEGIQRLADDLEGVVGMDRMHMLVSAAQKAGARVVVPAMADCIHN